MNACLLLVEDDLEDQRLLRYAPRTSARLTVDVASKGEAAIAHLAQARPFLILSDIPPSGSFRLGAVRLDAGEVGALRDSGAAVDVAAAEGEERARRMGAAGYVGKPRDLEGTARWRPGSRACSAIERIPAGIGLRAGV